MNENSLLCRLISSCPDWQRVVASKHINYKSEGPYAIFNYDALNCDFFDPVVQEARGIIIDTEKAEVVCWPFRKFGNYEESYADEIDWDSARVQEKIDGSIVKLWWSERNNEWVWSTNSCIYAKNAPATENLTFDDIIHEAWHYDYNILNKDNTYIFELVSPYTQVVIHYTKAALWHIGTRNNISGQEHIEYIGIQRPREYSLHSLDECVTAANNLNRRLETVQREGFVVVDKNWHRIKVKSPEYFIAHKTMMANPIALKKFIIFTLLSDHDLSTIEGPVVSYYRYWLEELRSQIQSCIDMSRTVYNEMGCNRKAAASLISREKFSEFGFKAIDRIGYSADDAIHAMTCNKLCRYIPTYSQPTF